MKNEKKARHYVFTIHNYTESELKQLLELSEGLDKHKFICFGEELGEEGETPHLQGYIQLRESQRFFFLHNYFNLKRDDDSLHKFHIEVLISTPEEIYTYCRKEHVEFERPFYEFGEMTMKKGERKDMQQLKEMIKENPTAFHSIVDEHATNMQQIRFTEKLSGMYLPKRKPSDPPLVFWLFGSTGIGKTKLVFDTFGAENICIVSDYQWLGTDYEQQECYLLDDFRSHNLKFNAVLRLADRYPYTLQYKGSQIPLNSRYIVFTSPMSIVRTFAESDEDLKQLKRRIIEIDMNAVTPKEINLRNFDMSLKYVDRLTEEEPEVNQDELNLDGIDF